MLTQHPIRVLPVAMLGMAVGLNGMAFYAIGSFVGPLHAAFGWSRTLTSGVVACLMAGQMLTAPLVGPVLARIETRTLAALSLLAMAAAYAGLGLVSTPVGYYFAWLLVALSGGGTTAVLWSRVILGRIHHRRGLMLGLALAGTGLAGIVIPRLLAARVATQGWQSGTWWLAAIAALASVPIWLGLGPGHEEGHATTTTGPTGVPLAAAVRQPSFWVLGLGFAAIALCVAALIVHLMPLLTDRGLAAPRAARIAGMIGLAALIGRAGAGALVDRLHPPVVATATVLLPAIAALWLAAGTTGAGPALLIGLAAGAEIDLLAFLCSWCFGLRHSARIHGWLVVGFCLGSAAGPPLAGWVRDATGSYRDALLGGVMLLTVSALALSTLRRMPP